MRKINIDKEIENLEKYPEKSMKRAERRKQDFRKAKRKRNLSKKLYDHEWYDNLHQYSKNKIHCSCPMCSGIEKTNNKKATHGKGHGPRQGFNHYGTTNQRRGKNWSLSDYKKIMKFKEELQEI